MSKKAKIVNSILVILSIIILVTYISLIDGPDKIIHVFLSANHIFICLGVAFMILYWYLEGHVTNKAVSLYGSKLSFKQSAKNCMIGQFFNNITPSSTGGQPMQVYYMSKCGISVGSSSGGLLIRFIIYQISLTIISIIVLIFKYNEFSSHVQSFSILMIFGFILNTSITLILLLIGFNKTIASLIMKAILILGNKVKIIKNFKKTYRKLKMEVDRFSGVFKEISYHKKDLIIMLGFTCLQLIVFFSINVTIAAAFYININLSNIFTIIAGAACVQMSSSFIPLPGAAGGAELAYYLLYSSVFPNKNISAAVLLWRLLTFYLPIIVGLFFSRDVFGKKIDYNNQ